MRALNADIRAWIAAGNNEPKPYVLIKTGDQIIESISRYCTTIDEPGQ